MKDEKIIGSIVFEELLELRPTYEEKLELIMKKKKMYKTFNLTDLFIIYYLDKLNNKPVTMKELIDVTGHTKRTISYSLKKLLNIGIVSKLPNLPDLRRYNYILNKKIWLN